MRLVLKHTNRIFEWEPYFGQNVLINEKLRIRKRLKNVKEYKYDNLCLRPLIQKNVVLISSATIRRGRVIDDRCPPNSMGAF